MKKLINSVGCAVCGIVHTFEKQRNFKIMSLFSILVIAFGFILKLNMNEWIFILLSIFTVLISEIVNTSVEYIVNLIHDKKNVYAKLAKDTAAGAVLMSLIWSIIVGVIIFGPKIISLF